MEIKRKQTSGKSALPGMLDPIKIYPVLVILLYIPFHLAEEAAGNFPAWMAAHYPLPMTLSWPHWLMNNGIFLLVLLAGLILFLRKPGKRLFLGGGIMVWAFINSLEHIIFTISDQIIAPGFWSALLFPVLGILFFLRLGKDKLYKHTILWQSILAGIGYWLIAFFFIIAFGLLLKDTFYG